jgi:Na+-transporting methylmalonyl-CoA/oxaloacetate decarboxylase gamma subunit
MPLTIDWMQTLLTALLGAAITAFLFLLVLLILRLCGIKLLWRRRSKTMRIKTPSPKKTDATDDEELSEEELIAILTAAALTALDGTDKNRFRVVAFRRI